MLIRPGGIGLRTIMVFPAAAALTQSGMILSAAKSPPPITFPARAVEMAQRPSSKRIFIAVGHKLGAGFAVGIGIIAIQIVTLPVAILPLPVLINLIRSHI